MTWISVSRFKNVWRLYVKLCLCCGYGNFLDSENLLECIFFFWPAFWVRELHQRFSISGYIFCFLFPRCDCTLIDFIIFLRSCSFLHNIWFLSSDVVPIVLPLPWHLWTRFSFLLFWPLSPPIPCCMPGIYGLPVKFCLFLDPLVSFYKWDSDIFFFPFDLFHWA